MTNEEAKKQEIPPVEAERQEVPPVEEAFAHLLKKYTIKGRGGMEDTIAEHISRTGGEYVFERPEILAERLANWHEYITPVKRKQIMEHWFAEKGIEISEDVVQAAGVKYEEREKKKVEAVKKKAEEEGRIWTITDEGRIRPAKEGEMAMTRAEAKSAAKELYGEEPPVVLDPQSGQYVPNPKSRVLTNYPHLAVMTAKEMNRLQATGEEADPLDVMMGQFSRVEEFREMVGGRKGEEQEKTTLTELVGALSELDRMRAPKEAPAKESIVDTIRELRELGLFGERDSAVTQEVTKLRESVEELREQARKAELGAIEERTKAQIQSLSAQLERYDRDRQDTAELLRNIAQQLREGKKTTSEYDIMSQVVSVVKEELSGARTDLKSMLGPGRPLPPAKRVAEEMTAEMARLEEADKLAEELWF